jgi:hypothetical protein
MCQAQAVAVSFLRSRGKNALSVPKCVARRGHYETALHANSGSLFGGAIRNDPQKPIATKKKNPLGMSSRLAGFSASWISMIRSVKFS